MTPAERRAVLQGAVLERALEAAERVVTAALLVAVACRLGDQQGLLVALRLLVQALDGLEQPAPRAAA